MARRKKNGGKRSDFSWSVCGTAVAAERLDGRPLFWGWVRSVGRSDGRLVGYPIPRLFRCPPSSPFGADDFTALRCATPDVIPRGPGRFDWHDRTTLRASSQDSSGYIIPYSLPSLRGPLSREVGRAAESRLPAPVSRPRSPGADAERGDPLGAGGVRENLRHGLNGLLLRAATRRSLPTRWLSSHGRPTLA